MTRCKLVVHQIHTRAQLLQLSNLRCSIVCSNCSIALGQKNESKNGRNFKYTILQNKRRCTEFMVNRDSTFTLHDRLQGIGLMYHAKINHILLAARAEAANSPILIFLCQHETWQPTLLQLPTAKNSFFPIKYVLYV